MAPCRACWLARDTGDLGAWGSRGHLPVSMRENTQRVATRRSAWEIVPVLLLVLRHAGKTAKSEAAPPSQLESRARQDATLRSSLIFLTQ